MRRRNKGGGAVEEGGSRVEDGVNGGVAGRKTRGGTGVMLHLLLWIRVI